MKIIKSWFILLSVFVSCGNPGKQPVLTGKRTVEIITTENGFHLFRNGQPYVIKGVCVLDAKYLQQAKECGANSIRTYGTANASEVLNAAGKLGLTVTLGLKLPYAGIEMDYSNVKEVDALVEKVRKEVHKYKDHPALLMWGVGNELNLYLKSSSVGEYIALLRAINRIAKVIHETDPNHPTTTTVPYVRKTTISAMNMICDNLDIISINSFESLHDMPEEAKNYSKPYIISEYGANGYWLTGQTDWNTHVEQTSQEKAAFIIRQSNVIKSDTAKCLGSYVFVWGHKLEYTGSWFSMFTEKGEASEVVDALQFIWTGKWPAFRSPVIDAITINNHKSAESIYLQPGKSFMVSISTSNDVSDLYVTGQLQKDDLEIGELYKQAHFGQKISQDLLADSMHMVVAGNDLVKENGKLHKRINIQFQAPAVAGPYRLFITLHNHRNRIATANACFYVHD